MKKILINTLIVFLSAFVFGCGDKWLEDTDPQDGTLIPEQILSSKEGIDNAFAGMVRYFNSYGHAAPGLSANTVSFGAKNILCLATAYMGNDIVCDPGTWWLYESRWQQNVIHDKTGYRTGALWSLHYKAINNANTIIVSVPNTNMNDVDKGAAISAAKAFRAYNYWHLSRSYQLPITRVPGSSKVVPIYTEPATGASKGNPVATLDQINAQILEDLSDENIAKLYNNKRDRKSIYLVTQDVAYGWRAQAKLDMGDYAGAAADALKAIGGSLNSDRYPLMDADTYKAGFSTVNSEWIWGVPQQADQSPFYASFYSFTDYMADGYQCFFINKEFKKLFSATDIRGQQIVKLEDLTAGTKFQIKPGENDYNYLTSTKFRASDLKYAGDLVYLRASEMILIYAEGMARTGSTGLAQDALFTLQSARDPQAVRTTKTGDDLVEEILVERRKELYGEFGVDYFDARRLGRPIIRTGNHAAPNHTGTLAADDKRWMVKIPLSEEQSNPNLYE